ncbi:MAG TPA: dihydroneopterin aldolase [Phnomibacter sp.]|nr:dihydroneopterin aldolase [Phnomibacter sp.]
MLTIYLKDLEFTAYHGVYAQEKLLGNQFVVQVAVGYMPAASVIRHMAETINYENIFTLVQQHMARSTPLLETVVTNIADAIGKQFARAEWAEVEITKKNPPIPGLRGQVAVKYRWQRS